jgi:signal transduction histidine kinase
VISRKTLIQIFALGPVLFIPAVIFFVSNLVLDIEQSFYEQEKNQLEQDYLENEKSRIQSKVTNMVDLVQYQQSIINKNLHSRIQRRVEDANTIAMTLYNFYVNRIPEEELKELIIESLRPLSWNGGESYIWIVNYQGVLQLGPSYLKKSEGSSIIDFKDATGRKIIEEEIAITKSQGQGFLWDTFTKAGEPLDKQFKQLAYVKKFGKYDWYFGSGEYLDTATKMTNGFLLETLNQIGKGDADYFFVIDTKGKLLSNPARQDLVGRAFMNTDNLDLRKLYKKIVVTAQSGSEDFLSYQWLNPVSGSVDLKYTFVKKVPDSNWVIGSGFYPKNLDKSYQQHKNRIESKYEQKFKKLTILSWLAVVIALIVSSAISFWFYRILLQYQRDLVLTNNELKDLNLELESQLLNTTEELKQVNEELNALTKTDSLT